MLPPLATVLYLIAPASPSAMQAATPTTDDSGFPIPPSDAPKQYRVWRSRLPKAMQKKIVAHCREHDAEYQQICNGIGPLAIPSPPPLDLDDPSRRKEWLHSLTAAQRHYVAQYCDFNDDDASINRGYSELCGGTPIVLAFASERLQFSAGPHTDVPTVATPWLARDLNGDGQITADELFGSGTVLPDGSRARHGLATLAALDTNHDGQLDASDPAFDALLVWADQDLDRVSSPDELSPAKKILESLSSVSSAALHAVTARASVRR